MVKTTGFVALLTAISFVNTLYKFNIFKIHPDTGLDVKQIIKKYGYPLEIHTVQTEDGYILEIHRIAYGKNNTGIDKRPSVLCMPGLLSSSADWVAMGPENGLGFILADQGYDVWLANYRGSRWSRRHTKLDPDRNKSAYWNFSFHQIGYYDIAAIMDYILVNTNQDKLFYIGHSQGTTSFFVLACTRPEYNNKVRLSIALAPAAYSGYMKNSVVHLWIIFQNQIDALATKYEFYELFSYNPYLGLLSTIFCNDQSPFQNICAAVFYVLSGYTPDQFNKTMISVITSNTPAGSSIRQVQHYAQLFTSKKFRQYDYGEQTNLEKYGQSLPPEYELDKVTAPLAFYYGDKDSVCVREDIDHTTSELTNLVENKRIQGFSHIDVLWGIDAAKIIFSDVIQLMKNY